ncbi:MAG TPA: amidohydrolase family protein, partial [Dehalococcoidia bacterium]|nr:amidohydrolase family protein [Dehalococcoidia bacterium]
MANDLLIRNGRIVDGSGMPSYIGDVSIKDGKIREIGSVRDREAARVIDADGLAVSPGFIDHHTHLDAQLLWDPYGTSCCWHGVTTVITGNCSLTLYPAKPEDRDALVGSLVRVEAMSRKALEAGVKWTWESSDEYLRRIGERLGINVACHVGHTAIRQYVLGEESSERASTPEEIARMQDLLRDALWAGAIGFTANTSPNHLREDGRRIPAGLATDEEIVALAGVLREFNTGAIEFNPGTVGVHRQIDEGIGLFKAMAQASGRPVLWTTITHRWSQPTLWKELLSKTAEAFQAGHRIYGLTSSRPITFRFNLKNAQVFDGLPVWRPLFIDTDLEKRRAALQDPEMRAKMRYDAVEDPTPRTFSKRWDLVFLLEAKLPHNKRFEGKSVAEIAKIQGKDIIDAFFDMSLEEDLETVFETTLVQGDPEAAGEILKSPYTLIGLSDAGAHTVFDAGYAYSSILLGHWVRDRGLMSLEEGVRELTFVPASIFGLYDRGLLRPGLAADVTIFDPAAIGPREAELVHDYPAG